MSNLYPNGMSAHRFASTDFAAKQPVIGVDIGGTGIKAAAVRMTTGELVTKRHKLNTPEGGYPHDIAEAAAQLVNAIQRELSAAGEHPLSHVGVCVPAVVQNGITLSAANIAQEWIGLPAERMFFEAIGKPIALLNDADAAGEAELDFGAAANTSGLTMVLTLGTGIGSALLYEGTLVPGTELGHLNVDGVADYERFASPKRIHSEGISIREWANRLASYLRHLERLFSPNLFVLGGSISKSIEDFAPLPGVTTPTVAAHFLNNSGIVGAAGFALQQIQNKKQPERS
jgi:polyphosphate glucokinase